MELFPVGQWLDYEEASRVLDTWPMEGEARCGEPASRNTSELDSASLRKVGAAIPRMG